MKQSSPIHMFGVGVGHYRGFSDADPGASYAKVSTGRLFDIGSATGIVIQVTNQQVATGTLPTIDIRVQHSCDGVYWDTLADFDQFDGSVQTKTVSIPGEIDGQPKTCGQFIRLMGKVGGTSPNYNYVSAVMSLKG